MSGVLKQKKSSDEVTIGFSRRVLKPHIRNYTNLEKETLAIIFSIKKFEDYLHKEFVKRTDHKPLVWLYKMTISQGKIARWLKF